MPDWLLRALGPVVVVAVAVTAGVLFERFDKPAVPAAPAGAPVVSDAEESDPPPPPPPVPPGAAGTLPDLPVQDVRPLAAHPVPDTEPPVPHVTLQDRQGNVIARPAQASAPRQQAALPPLAPVAPPPSLAGSAHATGTVSLAIEGHALRLYGVLPPASTDRCSLGTGEPQPCAEVTQIVLSARLARSASVTCRMPTGANAADSARICLDATGVDLAGFLISQGLVVADRRAADYGGAEGIARTARRGLWLYR